MTKGGKYSKITRCEPKIQAMVLLIIERVTTLCKKHWQSGVVSILKQEKGCMSVTDFTRLHICRQSRQNKGFSDFCTLKKVYVGKSALG